MFDIDKLLIKCKTNKLRVARKMKISRTGLYRILSGNPTLSSVSALADALDVPLWRLIYDCYVAEDDTEVKQSDITEPTEPAQD
jgi:transcriptional regulator with XRE-family HTH domain